MKELILIYTNRAKLDTYINYLTTHSIPFDRNKGKPYEHDNYACLFVDNTFIKLLIHMHDVAITHFKYRADLFVFIDKPIEEYFLYLFIHGITIHDTKKEIIRRAYEMHHTKIKENPYVCP